MHHAFCFRIFPFAVRFFLLFSNPYFQGKQKSGFENNAQCLHLSLENSLEGLQTTDSAQVISFFFYVFSTNKPAQGNMIENAHLVRGIDDRIHLEVPRVAPPQVYLRIDLVIDGKP